MRCRRDADALVATEAIPLTSVPVLTIQRKLRLRWVGVARAARQEVANFNFDLGRRAVDATDIFHREHDALVQSTAWGVTRHIIGAGKHPAPEQRAVRRVEGVAVSPARCADREAALAEVLGDCRVRQRRTAFERQEVITPACEGLFDKFVAMSSVCGAGWHPMASRDTMLLFSASWSISSGTAVISFDLPSMHCWSIFRPCLDG